MNTIHFRLAFEKGLVEVVEQYVQPMEVQYFFTIVLLFSLQVLSPSPSGGAAEGGETTGDGNDPVYELGTLGLTGLDFNCHGFTEFLCQERVEYGWLMQLLVGRITGAVCTEQVL